MWMSDPERRTPAYGHSMMSQFTDRATRAILAACLLA